MWQVQSGLKVVHTGNSLSLFVGVIRCYTGCCPIQVDGIGSSDSNGCSLPTYYLHTNPWVVQWGVNSRPPYVGLRATPEAGALDGLQIYFLSDQGLELKRKISKIHECAHNWKLGYNNMPAIWEMYLTGCTPFINLDNEDTTMLCFKQSIPLRLMKTKPT